MNELLEESKALMEKHIKFFVDQTGHPFSQRSVVKSSDEIEEVVRKQLYETHKALNESYIAVQKACIKMPWAKLMDDKMMPEVIRNQ